jgi:hypothetical protein
VVIVPTVSPACRTTCEGSAPDSSRPEVQVCLNSADAAGLARVASFPWGLIRVCEECGVVTNGRGAGTPAALAPAPWAGTLRFS